MPVAGDASSRWAGHDRAPAVVPAKIRVPVTEAVPRERLEASLTGGAARVVLVIAPAGSGKTTLLARVAVARATPVAWYRAEALDRDEPTLVRHLEAALTGAVPGLRGGWQGVDDLVRVLEAHEGGPVALVVDDFQRRHFLLVGEHLVRFRLADQAGGRSVFLHPQAGGLLDVGLHGLVKPIDRSVDPVLDRVA